MIRFNDGKYPQIQVFQLKGRKAQKFNLKKYRLISIILDYMAYQNGLTYKGIPIRATVFNESKLINYLKEVGIINSTCLDDIATYNSVIAQMTLMGLIETNNGTISLTQFSIDHYQNQTFHQIYASLLASEDSRNLSKITIWISSFAAFIAVISILISYFLK